MGKGSPDTILRAAVDRRALARHGWYRTLWLPAAGHRCEGAHPAVAPDGWRSGDHLPVMPARGLPLGRVAAKRAQHAAHECGDVVAQCESRFFEGIEADLEKVMVRLDRVEARGLFGARVPWRETDGSPAARGAGDGVTRWETTR